MDFNSEMKDRRIKVLFIAGASRSGSTMLHNLLGQLDGYTAVGEIREIWRRGFVEDWLCGCGHSLNSCSFWTRVEEGTLGSSSTGRAQQMADLTEKFRTKHLFASSLSFMRRPLLARVGPLLRSLGRLYQSIQKVSDARVIVDSSKNPSFGYLLHQIPELDVYDLQLVRHPAAVAYSWRQRKSFEPGKFMAQKPPYRAGAEWMARNLAVEKFIRPLSEHFSVMRYEDYIMDPSQAVEAVVHWLGEPTSVDLFAGRHIANFADVDHSVFGNESRFQRGHVELRYDDRWHDHMRRRDLLAVGAVTFPLLSRYGYTLNGSTPEWNEISDPLRPTGID